MVRLIVTVMFSFTSGRLAIVNAFIITTVVVGILTFWFFVNGVYKNVYLSTPEVVYLLNIFLLSNVSLATISLKSNNYQIATIISVSMSFAVCLVTISINFWLNFDIKKIKQKLGFKVQPEYIPVPQVATDSEEDRRPGSPPSVYNQDAANNFSLEFLHQPCGQTAESPAGSLVLVPREPLVFDNYSTLEKW